MGERSGANEATLPLGPGAVLLRGFAAGDGASLLDAVAAIARLSPFRHMATRGGGRMSVATTSCGSVGWCSDRRGYRYDPLDPETGRPWPAMPTPLAALADAAAGAAGHGGFRPDTCLVNRYAPGARMGLHQDRDERDLSAPIVSVSLGLPAVFLWGGTARAERPRRLPLAHGDVVVWGGASRLVHHGVAVLRPGEHALAGGCRINLTFRRALSL